MDAKSVGAGIGVPGSQPDPFRFVGRRSAVLTTHAAVASSQPLATFAGVEVLKKGGNAVDAAVAVAAALQVTEPCSTGLGGDCFCLFYEAKSKKVFGLNGSGRAPAALTLEKAQAFARAAAIADVPGAVAVGATPPVASLSLPDFSVHCVTVPGAAAGWCDAVEKWGRLPLRDSLAPAIALAEGGYAVASTVAESWARNGSRIRTASAHGAELMMPDGQPPKTGDIFKNPTLARTLKTVCHAHIGHWFLPPQ
jgi:gamma-glutamyltranspeptidase / glutathione hydrolase